METKLIELLKLCIEKNLNYDFSSNKTVGVSEWNTEDRFTFRERIWICSHEDVNEEQLNQLIEKVKNYKK